MERICIANTYCLYQANTIKFITLTKENAVKYNNRASRLWLLGIISSIFNGILKVCNT